VHKKAKGDPNVKLPAHRAGLPGKEEFCFLLRPLSSTRLGLRNALPVKRPILQQGLIERSVSLMKHCVQLKRYVYLCKGGCSLIFVDIFHFLSWHVFS
jgi:hypothetical protein